MQLLLDTEFPEVEKRIEQGLLPLEYYAGVEEDAVQCRLEYGRIEEAQTHTLLDGKTKFAVSYDEDKLYIRVCADAEVIISTEFQLMRPYPPIAVTPAGQVKFYSDDVVLYYELFGDRYEKEIAKWKAVKTQEGTLVTVARSDISWTENTPIKLSVKTRSASWIREEEPVYTLGKWTVSPGEFGWFLP